MTNLSYKHAHILSGLGSLTEHFGKSSEVTLKWLAWLPACDVIAEVTPPLAQPVRTSVHVIAVVSVELWRPQDLIEFIRLFTLSTE